MDKIYSVLMSVYNKENPIWLKESIDSMLNQTISPAEIVLVKDGQLTEELEKVIEDYQQGEPKLFNIVTLKENRGLGIALCKGVEACSNEIIVRMDTDDYSCPERVERQLEAMEKYSADIVSCNIGEFQKTIDVVHKYKEVPETHPEIYQYAKRRNPFNHPSVVFRKSKVLQAGNYQKVDWIEDYDLWIRMLMDGSVGYNVQQSLLLMRVNDNAYRRRGGWMYMRSMLAFNRKWKKQGWFSFKDYMIRGAGNIFVALSPNRIRNIMYKKLLRK